MKMEKRRKHTEEYVYSRSDSHSDRSSLPRSCLWDLGSIRGSPGELALLQRLPVGARVRSTHFLSLCHDEGFQQPLALSVSIITRCLSLLNARVALGPHFTRRNHGSQK